MIMDPLHWTAIIGVISAVGGAGGAWGATRQKLQTLEADADRTQSVLLRHDERTRETQQRLSRIEGKLDMILRNQRSH